MESFREWKKLRSTPEGRRGLADARGAALPVYMHPIELGQLAAVLRTLAPTRSLEWGSGGSTAAILAMCGSIETHVSVEHHPGWYERVRERVVDPRLRLHCVPGAEPEPEFPGKGKERKKAFYAWTLRGEREPELFADYVRFPSTLGMTFQFVLVDGRARVHCMRAGYELLEPGGVLVVHDAERDVYQDAIAGFADHVFLEPWVQGQVCLIRKPSA